MCIKIKFILITIICALIFLPACHNVSNDFRIEKLPNMKIPREGHTAITLNDGRVLIFNYYPRSKPDEAEIFDPKTKTFNLIGKTGGNYSYALNMPDSNILLIGYHHLGMFNPKNLKFNTIKNVRPLFGNAILLNNKAVLFSDGKSIEVYDPKNWKLLKTAKLIKQRKGFQTLSLPDGKVLFIGGFTIKNEVFITEVEAYDFKTNVSKIVGQLKVPRDNFNFLSPISGINFVCLLMNNEKVFIASAGDKVEIYDTKTNQSEVLNNTLKEMKGKSNLTAVKLHDGRILLYGEVIEVYNPDNNSFGIVKDDILIKNSYQLTLIKDGNVLVTGGYGSDPMDESDTILYPLDFAELIYVVNKKERKGE